MDHERYDFIELNLTVPSRSLQWQHLSLLYLLCAGLRSITNRSKKVLIGHGHCCRGDLKSDGKPWPRKYSPAVTTNRCVKRHWTLKGVPLLTFWQTWPSDRHAVEVGGQIVCLPACKSGPWQPGRHSFCELSKSPVTPPNQSYTFILPTDSYCLCLLQYGLWQRQVMES